MGNYLPDPPGPPVVGEGSALVAVIEDDPSFRRALQRLLALRGFRTEGFASAEEFLQAPATAAECIVLDIHLGGMSGLELQAALKANGVPLPIVFITAFDNPATQKRARDAGAAGYLQKPFDDELLVSAIRRAIGRPSPNNHA
jgi:FixJ family two-component response regulator